MSFTWVVKTSKGGSTVPAKPSDGFASTEPQPYRLDRFAEIGVECGLSATPCDVHCIEAFIVELQAVVAYLKGCD
jgi:hypothetical protein